MPALHFPYTSLTLSQTLKHLSKKSKITLAFAFFLTAVIHNQLYLLTSRGIRSDNVVIKDSEVLYVPNQAVLEVLSLGYHQAAADLLWIRTIGYFADHFDSDRKYQWLEHFIDQILALDPKFKRVYYWAGTNVLYGRRFTNPNVRLSNRFYEKALKQFPDDYEAPYRLGLNYYIEMKPKDEEEKRYFKEIGLNYLEIAANIPDAPNNIRTLVASISDKLGKEQVALQYLIELYLTAEDQDKKQAFLERIKEARQNMQSKEFLSEAELFREDWRNNFPYTSLALFSLLRDVKAQEKSWRELLPDVNVSGKLE